MTSDEEKQGLFARVADHVQRIPGAALMFAVGPLVFLGYFGWLFYGAEHLDRALYAFDTENLTVTPQPTWIRRTQVIDEVIEVGALEELSLLDPQITATIAQAFETHAWIKSTLRVAKSGSGELVVDLLYREPRALVFQPIDSDVSGGEAKFGFYAVDDEGYVLPRQDFDSEDAFNYLAIIADGIRPTKNKVRMAFGDKRISEALELCRFLSPVREKLGLQAVFVLPDESTMGANGWLMYLETVDGHKISWGHAPTHELVDEENAKGKLARLKTWLEEARQGDQPLHLDLQKPQSAMQSLPASTANLPVWNLR